MYYQAFNGKSPVINLDDESLNCMYVDMTAIQE